MGLPQLGVDHLGQRGADRGRQLRWDVLTSPPSVGGSSAGRSGRWRQVGPAARAGLQRTGPAARRTDANQRAAGHPRHRRQTLRGLRLQRCHPREHRRSARQRRRTQVDERLRRSESGGGQAVDVHRQAGPQPLGVLVVRAAQRGRRPDDRGRSTGTTPVAYAAAQPRTFWAYGIELL